MTRGKNSFPNAITKDIFASLRSQQDPLLDTRRECRKREYLAKDKPSRVLKRWNEFVSEVALETEMSKFMRTTDLKNVPTIDLIEAFFIWLVRTKPGQADRPRCINTMQREWDMLQRIVDYQSGQRIQKDVTEDVKRFIKNLAETENATSCVSQKGLASIVDVEDLIHYLWVCDEHTFKHPRERLQLAFAILIFGSLGIRPGELVESNHYPDSNEGLKYKDFELQVDRNGTFTLLLTRRLMKRKRGELDKSQKHVMFEIPQDRSLCPLTSFFALAVADGVLDVGKLSSRTVEHGANARVISLNKDKLELPVLRATVNQSKIASQKILKYNSLEYCLINLGLRAGYKEPLTTYCFRRGAGNAADKVVTSAERQQIMGHSNERMFQSYISRVCAVDSQAVGQGGEQRVEEIDLLRSMTFHRNLNAPRPHTASLTKSGKRPRTFCDSKEEYENMRLAKRRKLVQERSVFFEDPEAARSSSSFPDLDEDRFEYVTRGRMVRVRPKPSRWAEGLLRYDHVRAEVVRNFFHRESKEPLPLDEALLPLIKMANPETFVVHYPLPGISETTTQCPWCEKKLDRSQRLKFNWHLLQCFKKYYQKKLIPAAQEACLFKSVGICDSDPSPPKPTLHLSQESHEVRASVCRWTGCTFDFVNKPVKRIAKHMMNHVRHSSDGRCRWASCSHSAINVMEMEGHLLEAHGAPSKSTLDNQAFFCHQCASWSTSTYAWEKHCEQHIEDLQDTFCGSIIFNSLMICAPLCPFCLGRTEVAASKRYVQLPQHTMKSHILLHIRDFRRPFHCPHPLCKGPEYDGENYLDHLDNSHEIVFRMRRRTEQGSVVQEADSGCTSESELERACEAIDLAED